MGVLFGAKVIILLTNPSRLLKKRAKSPTINAAMIVPSRTPSMLPAIIREAAQARSASVVSKADLGNSEFFSRTQSDGFHKGFSG